MEALNKQFNKLSNIKAPKLTNFANSFNSTLENQSNKINKFYDDIENKNNKFSGFDKLGNSLKNTGKSLTMGITVPVVASIGASLNTGMKFESAMSSVEATLGTKANIEDMEKLKNKAIEMGDATTKSSTEAANAMEYMSLAGWNTEQIMEGILPILRMLEAGKSDLATTSDLVTDSMSALGLEVGELEGFLDKVAKTSTTFNTSSIELLEAFIVSAPKVKSLGGDLSEFSSILGAMESSGFKGATAGTALKSILTNLTSPTGQAKNALEQLGISAFDSKGDFIGLANTFKLLQSKLEGMTQEQQVSYVAMIGGKEHSEKLTEVICGLSKKFDGLTDDIRNSKGSLDNMATTMNDNAQSSIQKLKGKLENLGILISTVLLPAFSGVVGFLSNMIEKFSTLSPGVQNTIIVVAVLAAVIPPIISVVGSLTTGVKMLSTAFTFLSQNPIVAVIGVVVLLVGAVVTLWNTHEGFREGVINIWQGILGVVEGIVNKIIDMYNWVINLINKIPGVNIELASHVALTEESKKERTRQSMKGEQIRVGDNIAGSYKTGLSFVPYDGFVAELHKGERVLTEQENKNYNKLFSYELPKSIRQRITANTTNLNNSSTTNNTKNNNSTVNLSVNVNYAGSGNNQDMNNLAEQVAKIISEKVI